MKLYNRFLTATALLAIAGAVTSCSNKEDDIFDQAAAVRMDAAKTETKALLVSAENGWELSYFADNDWEEGHVILMKFHNDETVDMMGSNAWVANAFNYADMYTPQQETSLYQMISDDGPVLTFNTFNKVLHIFSEPYNLPSPQYNPNNVPFPYGPTEKNIAGNEGDVNEAGYGHNGDYEFVVLSRSENEIILRGKKTKIKMRMRRLDPDVDWIQYFAKTARVMNNTFSNRFGDLKIVVDGHELHLSNLTKGVMHILADDDDPLLETVKIPFIYTPDGIRLREPYTGYEDRLPNIGIQNFTFNDDGTLSCVEKPVEFALNSSFAEIFGMNLFSWDIPLDEATGSTKNIFDGLVAEAKADKTIDGIRSLYFQTSTGRKALTIRINKTATLGSLYGTYEYMDGSIIKMTFTGEDGDNTGKTRLNKLSFLKQYIDHISSTSWEVHTDSPMAPEHLTFINTSDSSDTFKVNLR